MSVFISHSRKDKVLRPFFDTIFAGLNTRAVRMEFEQFTFPPWETIRDEIAKASAVFLLLAPEVTSSDYTQNWVAFEAGLGCGLSKPIWTFERHQAPVKFPVPQTNHYMLVDVDNPQHFDYVKEVVKYYEPFIWALFRKEPTGIPVKCPYDDCQINFQLHVDIKLFNCPACRRQIKLEDPSKLYR